MNELQAQQMVAQVHASVIAKPRDYLERVEKAARNWLSARGRPQIERVQAEKWLAEALTRGPQ